MILNFIFIWQRYVQSFLKQLNSDTFQLNIDIDALMLMGIDVTEISEWLDYNQFFKWHIWRQQQLNSHARIPPISLPPSWVPMISIGSPSVQSSPPKNPWNWVLIGSLSQPPSPGASHTAAFQLNHEVIELLDSDDSDTSTQLLKKLKGKIWLTPINIDASADKVKFNNVQVKQEQTSEPLKIKEEQMSGNDSELSEDSSHGGGGRLVNVT